MRTPGMIRKVDSLGRIVIPATLRSSLGVESGDLLEMTVEGEALVLKKFSCVCTFCGGREDLVTYMDKPVCRQCIRNMSR